jgi:hypothetical protein
MGRWGLGIIPDPSSTRGKERSLVAVPGLAIELGNAIG